jgi:hypothetical protein
MTQLETTKAIQDFATKVRAALAGLSTDEIQELTDGLEADLAERAADQGANFGSAAAYAAELKAAAGLGSSSAPEGIDASGKALDGLVRKSLASRLETLGSYFGARIHELPALKAIIDWLKPLTPVLWIARAYLVYFFFAYNGLVHEFISNGHSGGYLPDGPITFTLLLALTFLSVQLGRGKSKKILTVLTKLVMSIWALMIIPSFVTSFSWAYYTGSNQIDYRTPAEGLYSAGSEVTNIFAYDSNGTALHDVQLFDQNGKPLAVGNNLQNDNGVWYHYLNESSENIATIPHTQSAWITGWNVYPLEQVSMETLYNGKPIQPTAAPLPFQKANPLVLNSDQSANGSSQVTEGPTSGPTAGPSATPTAAPTK